MARQKSSKPKRNVWTDTTSPYGTYEGESGNPDQWKRFFEQATYSREKSLGILVGTIETPYEILGISYGASVDQIKAAFRRKVLIYHPDKGGDREKFEKVMAAYSLLS